MKRSTEFHLTWDSFVAEYQEHNNLSIEHDSDWPSPCEQGTDLTAGQQVAWQPVLQHPAGCFTDVAQGLEIEFNPQLAVFYGRYFSDNLTAYLPARGPLTLLQAWSIDDLARMKKNLIAHVLMKRRLGQADTLFFAVTDEEDLNVVVDAASGQIMLEYVGQAPHELLADDLNAFVGQLVFQEK